MNSFQNSILRQFQQIVSEKNVLTKEVELLLYSYDAALDRAIPSCVVLPETAEQVSSIVKICHQNKIPFVARGAGTNLCGGTIPLHHACVIALSKMNRILKIDPAKRIAQVQPGVPNLFLKRALEPYALFYAPDPASQKSCTIGGNIGTNAGGPHCLKYGVTSHHVLALEVVLPDGQIIETDLTNSGPDWTGFFVGSEGTLGIVTSATLNLIPIPKFIETMLASFPSLESAIQTVTDIVASGILPATLEAMDALTVAAVEEFIHAGYPLNAEAVLLIEVDGDAPLTKEVEKIQQLCRKNNSLEFRLAKNEKEREKLWEGRRGSYPSLARRAPNVLVEDGAVPRNKLPQALKRIRKIASEYALSVSLVFHAGDGNLHPQILFDERNEAETRKVKQAGTEMLKACVELGGTISGEHGIGIDKREAMRWLFSAETLALFRRIKQALDPENLCNPDKLIPAVDQQESRPAGGSILSEKRERPRILEHDIENFTVTVEAGILLEELQRELAKKNQKALLPGGGTLGKLLETNPHAIPPIRDQILGMTAILPDGCRVSFGAKVMKNVAGYDVAKLFLGSDGDFGAIESVILKTYPINYSPSPFLYPWLFSQSGKTETPAKLKELQQKIKRALVP